MSVTLNFLNSFVFKLSIARISSFVASKLVARFISGSEQFIKPEDNKNLSISRM